MCLEEILRCGKGFNMWYITLTALSEVLDEVSLALELIRDILSFDELIVRALDALR